MRAARGRKGYLMTVWGLRESAKGMPMAEILATFKRLRHRTVAQIQEFIKGGGK